MRYGEIRPTDCLPRQANREDTMIGLLAVFVYIALNVVAIALDGRHRHGTFAAWWRS